MRKTTKIIIQCDNCKHQTAVNWNPLQHQDKFECKQCGTVASHSPVKPVDRKRRRKK